MNKSLPAILFLIILVLLYLVSNRPSGSRQELEKQQARGERRLDSISARMAQRAALDSALIASLRGQNLGLCNSLKMALNQAAKREKIKPLIRPTDAQLDSAIARLYPR